MRIIGETHIPFLSYRKIAVTVSAIVVGAGVLWIAAGVLNPQIKALRFGIDFTGGTQVLAKFREAPDLGRLRSTLTGVSTDAPIIQRFDEAEKHQVLIRLQVPAGEQADLTRPVIDRLAAEFNADVEFHIPKTGTTAEQQAIVEALIAGTTPNTSPVATASTSVNARTGGCNEACAIPGICCELMAISPRTPA